MLGTVHSTLGLSVIGLAAALGLWGTLLALIRKPPNKAFWVAAGIVIPLIVLQVTLGVVLLAQGAKPGTIHVFYGIVILFTFAFAYIYRSQLAKRPALFWGLLFLFVTGLGIRGWLSFGQSF